MMQNPKILQVIPELDTGGAEKTTLDIGNALVEKGWRSIVVSAGGRMVDELRDGGSTHINLPVNSKNPLTILRNAFRLKKLIKEQGIDLIHARSRAPAWSCLIAARQAGIPYVSTYHGAYNEGSKLKALYNSVMARADTVIANSHWTAALVEERNPWSKDRITVVHRGTDYDAFEMSAISSARLERLKTKWDIKPGTLTVLHLARITGWKGQNVVIDAASKVVADHPNLKFILAGDAQGRETYLETLNSSIAKYGLENHVSLPGHCDDPAAAMALADIVLVASTEAEAFGRAAVEAGALEKPVIVTRIGAVGETVLATPEVGEEQRTGWKVQPGDADDLAHALGAVLIMDKKQRTNIGKRARIHGKNNFSLQQMCAKTIKIYEQLLQNRS